MPDIQGAALVTGGARRIGRCIAERLAREDWPVVIHYNASADVAEAAAEAIRSAGGVAATVGGDLTDSAVARGVVPAAAKAIGRPIACLVNNASVFANDGIGSFESSDFDLNMAVHARAPAELASAMAAGLPDGMAGVIINLLDQKSFNPDATFFSYTISKYALLGLTEVLAVGLAPRIRVNGVALGMTLPPPSMSDARFRELQAATPLGHGATPEDVADAVAYLVSARNVTGEVIAVDGGEHMGVGR